MGSLIRTRFAVAAIVATTATAVACPVAQAAAPTVAIIDTGVETGQDALTASLWINPGEVPGNLVDDDGDGIVDDVHGADVEAGVGNPSDAFGHGTEMANLLLRRAHGSIVLMPVKVFDGVRTATPEAVAAGLRYAVAHGARILLVSLNTRDPSAVLADAVREASAAGALIVTSAGNDGVNLDVTPSYPASEPDPGVITVGSTGRDGALSAFSNWGRHTVDVAALGEDVSTIGLGGRTVVGSGTSEAAAATAGSLGALAAAHPDATAATLKGALFAGALRGRGVIRRVAFGKTDHAASLAQLAGARPSSARARIRLVSLRARRRGHGTVLSWRAAGAANAVVRFRVRVGRRVRTVSAGRSGRSTWTLRLPSRARRVAVIALDWRGRRLAQAAATVREPRP